jgi:homoserine acetyltransferase
MNYFKKEGKKFEKRFSLSSLVLLSQAIVDAKRITPEEYVKKISEKINLIIISIEDDNLFETEPMQKYFEKVKQLREKR